MVDSVVIYFNEIGIDIKNIIHPIFYAKRSKVGDLEYITDCKDDINESVMQFHLDSKLDSNEIKSIKSDLNEILLGVHAVFSDWKQIIEIARKSKLQFDKINNKNQEVSEYKDFIDWLCDHNFIFLGSCELDLVKQDGKYSLKEKNNSKLGVFKSKSELVKPSLVDYSSADIRDIVKNPYLIEVLKSRYKSRIHRNVNAERIRIQKFNDKGEVIGEYRFVGLLTSSVYYQPINSIPIIRQKVAKVIKEANFKPYGHSYKDLVSVLESYPKDELFQIDYSELFKISLGMVAMSGRSMLKIFARNDKFNRFVSFLIFIPRDRFNTQVKEEVHDILTNSYDGDILTSYIQITESNLARMHVVVSSENSKNINISQIEKRLFSISSLWIDNFIYNINHKLQTNEAKEIVNNFQDAFSASYTNRFTVDQALEDIKFIQDLQKSNDVRKFRLYDSDSLKSKNISEIKIYSKNNSLYLSDTMPVLESFGFKIIHEHTYTISPERGSQIWIYYFTLNLGEDVALNSNIMHNFEETINRIYQKTKPKLGF